MNTLTRLEAKELLLKILRDLTIQEIADTLNDALTSVDLDNLNRLIYRILHDTY